MTGSLIAVSLLGAAALFISTGARAHGPLCTGFA